MSNFKDFLLAGLVIVEDPNLLVDGEPYETNRTWSERLFTLPWEPMRKTKTVTPKIPDPNFYRDHHSNRLIAHPATILLLKQTWAGNNR